MSSRHQPTLPQQVRRLTAALVGAFVLLASVAAVIVVVLARHDAKDDQLARTDSLLLTLDELNESLRGDLLAGTGADASARSADVEELRSVVDAADVSALTARLRATTRGVLLDERKYSDEVAAAFDGAGVSYVQHRTRALSLVGPLTDRVDAVRAEVGALSEARVASTRSLETTLLVVLALVGAGALGGSVVLVRRVVGGVSSDLVGLTETVRAVSSGDMEIRTGIRRDDALGALALVLDDMADGLGDAMSELKSGYGDQERRGRVARALEQTEGEPDVHAVVARAVTALTGDVPSRLLIADASEMHLLQMAGSGDLTGCCDVASPGACPAIRGGRTLLMPVSDEIDSCPRLRDRPGAPVSAVCTPVTFLGKALGVVQVLGAEGQVPAERMVHGLHDIAHLAGSRIGTMRALSQAQRQATVDPLTGLLNRRTLEDRVRALTLGETPYAVAMLDLDHFKALNDSRGHEVGDRALKTFAQCLRENLRSEDVIARYGGEEFVVVFPGCEAADALQALLHVRGALAATVAQTGVAFTFSGGVTDTRTADGWQVQLRTADAGLMACKQNGRDCLAIGDLVQEERRQAMLPGPR